MKPHMILLMVLAFAAGVWADQKKPYYHIDPVDANTFYVSCAQDRPFTTMRIDDVMEVHCHTPQ